MGSIGIVPEILSFVIGIGVIGHPLTYSELQIPFKKIEVIVGIQTKIFSQCAIVHILVYKGIPNIGIVVQLLPFFIAKGFLIVSKNET